MYTWVHLIMRHETDHNISMATKKKKTLIANNEPVQNKKKKKKNDDPETLTKHKKRKHSIEEPRAEKEYTVEICNKKKKKKESKVKEEFALKIFPCAEDNDLSFDNNQLEPKDETFCKPEKSKKKKKKDRKVVFLTEVDNNEELQRLCPEKISRKNKKTKHSTSKEIVHQLGPLSKTVSGIGDAHEKTKKKKKKEKQPQEGSIDEAHNHLEPNDETSCKSENSKKKKRKKRCKDECIDHQAQTHLEPNDETSCQPENSKKKKKKNKLALLEVQVEELQTLSAEQISTKKKKAKQSTAEQSAHQLPALSETVVSVTEEVYEETITKKKKKKKRPEKRIQPALPETEMENGECEFNNHNLASISNNKKKKKRVHQAQDNITINSDTLSNKDTQNCDKSTNFNNMKRHMLDGTISNEIPKSKKKKDIKFKQEGRSDATMRRQALQDEVDRASGKVKMRRQALQDEVDRASGKVKESHFGQWQTATFDNPDQKNKFFRLMGGFKNFSPSSALSPVETEKPNQALSKTGEDTLKTNLLSEFEKAIDLKKHRGIGLGFQPESKKYFYIDKTRSNSIKFDN